MVATTFSADTPNLVADIVRSDGVSGNWVWWAFLLTGMLTVFLYARLWRRSGVLTDLSFYELRYGGKSAAFLRGFRAIYLGVVFNVIIMATVCLAAIKISAVLLGFTAIQTLTIAGLITVVYSSFGGLRGVILTDFVQFIIAMAGSVAACLYILNMPEIGGAESLLARAEVVPYTSFFPDFSNPKSYIPLFIIPLAVQWWSVWYPGAEPGGGGYIVQRMLSAKSEKHALAATLFFNVAHYALRPWPWILVGLASLVVFPVTPDLTAEKGSIAFKGLQSLAAAFPNIPADKIGHDLAYPAMLRFLPAGLAGLVLASLAAAFMSTISTHLNWGASYLVNDFYARFINPQAPEKRKVAAGRIVTVILMALSAILALFLESALDTFTIILQIGAGTGLIFILRWFWWRINAWTEITGMAVSFLVALTFHVFDTGLSSEIQLLCSVGITTLAWVLVTLLTPPEEEEVLRRYCLLVQPGLGNWSRFYPKGTTITSGIGSKVIAMLAGTFAVYSALFATGNFIYGEPLVGLLLSGVFVTCTLVVMRQWKTI
jgi:Na+/proline symporter